MFVLGGYLSLQGVDIDRLTCSGMKWLPAFALVYFLSAVIYPMHIAAVKAFYPFFYLCGIITLWCFYDIIHIDRVRWYEPLLGYGFFIYCSHMPFFNIVKKFNIVVFGDSQLSIVSLYFVNPIIAITIIVLIGKVLQRFWPNGYLVLTGFRK
jgi:hypothetical protein